MNSRIRRVAVAVATLVGLASFAYAANVADFYRGKHITLVIGYGPGGGYDLYARMLGRFIGAHIPGNPIVVPQNMPGAGSRSAANWLFKVAPANRDYMIVMSDYIKRKGYTKIAHLYSTDTFGQFDHTNLEKLAPKYG